MGEFLLLAFMSHVVFHTGFEIFFFPDNHDSRENPSRLPKRCMFLESCEASSLDDVANDSFNDNNIHLLIMVIGNLLGRTS